VVHAHRPADDRLPRARGRPRRCTPRPIRCGSPSRSSRTISSTSTRATKATAR
jgi:hypothetical protein